MAPLCDTLGVSRSGYYEWHERAPSARTVADATLVERIKAAHALSDETYGMPRVRAELADEGIHTSRKRIARLMRHSGIRGVSRRRVHTVTTVRNPRASPAPDLVKRKFLATDLNQLWVADMTYIPKWQGFLYLAVVTDVFSRKVVGWAFGAQMTADLVVSALNMALFTRKPESVIHHSDQGSQYTATAFGKRCAEDGCAPEHGHGGGCVRKRDGREFLRHTRVRTHRPAGMEDTRPGAACDLHVGRVLVQPRAAAVEFGANQSDGVWAAPCAGDRTNQRHSER